MGKSWSIGLSVGEIKKLQSELRAYKRELDTRCELARSEIANRIVPLAQASFNASVTEKVYIRSRVNGKNKFVYDHNAPMDVVVTQNNQGKNVTVVLATGNEVAFIEFGAGVTLNGSVGTSANPNGPSLGLTVGSYGKGHGSQAYWFWYEGGDSFSSIGTQGTAPLYHAVVAVAPDIIQIIKDVFDI